MHDVQPLALSHSAPKVDQVLRIAGWGSLSDINPTPATHLQTLPGHRPRGHVQGGHIALWAGLAMLLHR